MINVWEFTITIEPLYSSFAGSSTSYGGYANYNYGGRCWRGGSLRRLVVRDEQSHKDGKWRIPLGAYHPLMTYLTSTNCHGIGGGGRDVIEGIPAEQLRMASIGRERMDKRAYATIEELLDRNVHPAIARALAPYQRSGVEFILERDGRALLADEMGLGKTVQAIAAMSAYSREDWPLLVLCPSTARYHWEVEFRHWLGVGSMERMAADAAVATEVGEGGVDWAINDDDGRDDRGGGAGGVDPTFPGGVTSLPGRPSIEMDVATMKDGSITFLERGNINVLTSGRDNILKSDGSTRVVICSIGLIVNLVMSGRIRPGMFRAIVVDESHLLKRWYCPCLARRDGVSS